MTGWVWVAIAVVVVAAGVWAFWIRPGSINDRNAREALLKTQGDVEDFRPKNSGWGPPA